MNFFDSFYYVIIACGIMSFVVWYLHCWYDMLVKAQNIRAYFSTSFPSSALFCSVNIVALILFVAYLLHIATS